MGIFRINDRVKFICNNSNVKAGEVGVVTDVTSNNGVDLNIVFFARLHLSLGVVDECLVLAGSMEGLDGMSLAMGVGNEVIVTARSAKVKVGTKGVIEKELPKKFGKEFVAVLFEGKAEAINVALSSVSLLK